MNLKSIVAFLLCLIGLENKGSTLRLSPAHAHLCQLALREWMVLGWQGCMPRHLEAVQSAGSLDAAWAATTRRVSFLDTDTLELLRAALLEFHASHPHNRDAIDLAGDLQRKLEHCSLSTQNACVHCA